VSCLLIVKMTLFVNRSDVLKCITIYSMILSIDMGVLEMIVLRFGMHKKDIINAKSHVFALIVNLLIIM
jgi:hypothetical protein